MGVWNQFKVQGVADIGHPYVDHLPMRARHFYLVIKLQEVADISHQYMGHVKPEKLGIFKGHKDTRGD